MPIIRPKEETASMAEASYEDRISTLPDEIIQYLLGFLPAPEAVRTSLLVRGWRHHWKSMRSLRFTMFDEGPAVSAVWLNTFMRHLLRDLRGALDVCDIYVCVGQCDDVTALESYRWVRQAVFKHRARELMVNLEFLPDQPFSFVLTERPLVSAHLVRLQLCYVMLNGRILDFSRCPALEDLVMFTYDIGAKRISCQSLKHLRIDYCNFCKSGSRTRISAPNLIWQKLEQLMGASPVLETAPLLETAIVRLDDCNHDVYPCENVDGSGVCCGLCEGCVDSDDHSGGCTLLQGLSNAVHLELKVPFAKFADTTCYPAFTKLKTLLLDEWCVAADFRALIYILQHSPNLEKLTIELLNSKVLKNITELERNDYPVLRPASVSENLKVKCVGVDEGVSKISKLFSIFGIEVNIK